MWCLSWWWSFCRQHRGKIIGLAFSPVGDYLYSACSLGSLSLYDTESDRYTLLRLLANTVVRTERLGPEAIAVSPDGRRVAFIGPSEFTVCVVDAKSLSEVCTTFIELRGPEKHLQYMYIQTSIQRV